MTRVILENPIIDITKYLQDTRKLDLATKKWNKNLYSKKFHESMIEQSEELSKSQALTETKEQPNLPDEQATLAIELNLNKKVWKSNLNMPLIKTIELSNNTEGKYLWMGKIKYLLTLENDLIFIYNEDVNFKCIFDEDLKKCFEGWGIEDNVSKFSIDNFQKLTDKNLYLKSNNYYKELISEKGKGLDDSNIVFLPDNPIVLFEQLQKLLSATKAGHSNTYNQVNAILKRLMELQLITKDKYLKIIHKYFKI